MYDLFPETRKYELFSDDVIVNPGLVSREIYRDLIASIISTYCVEWEDEYTKHKHKGWMLRNGSIGLRGDAPRNVVENWKGYIRYTMRTSGMTDEEIAEFERKQQNAQSEQTTRAVATISDVLSTSKFDDRILRALTTDDGERLRLGRGFLLAAVIDDEYGGDYSKKRTDYADVIVASVTRLQERGLLSKFENV